MDIYKFGEFLVKMSKKRLKQSNDDVKSGLFRYYKTYFLQNKYFYFNAELAILNYINENYNKKKCKILEIGCGCGQISLGLRKVFDFINVHANDRDKRRVNYGEFLNQNIEPKKKVTYLTCDYRNMNLNDYDVIIITNIRHDKIGITEKEAKQFFDFLKNKNKHIIFQPHYYGSRGTDNIFLQNYKNNKLINVEKIWNCDNTQVELCAKVNFEGMSKPYHVEKVSGKF